jgi:hypothetical protein
MVFASQSRAVAGKCPLLIRQSSQRKTASKSRVGERLKLKLENTERFGEHLKSAREFKAQKECQLGMHNIIKPFNEKSRGRRSPDGG